MFFLLLVLCSVVNKDVIIKLVISAAPVVGESRDVFELDNVTGRRIVVLVGCSVVWLSGVVKSVKIAGNICYNLFCFRELILINYYR